MSEVIQPAAGQTVITTDNHHRDHGHDRHHHATFDSVEARADFRALSNEVERFGTVNGDRINTVGAAGALASCHTDQLVLEGHARDREVVQAGFGVVHDRICDATGKVVGAVGTVGTAGALAACETDKAIADVKFIGMETAKDNLIAMNVGFSAGQSGVNTGFAAQSVLATTIGNAQSVLSNSIGNAAAVQATNYFNQSTIQLERVRAELEAKQAAGFAAAALLAFQNKSDSDAKAAKCCCDGELRDAENFAKLQALIISESSSTRAQAADFRMRDLEAQLARIPRGTPVTLPVGI